MTAFILFVTHGHNSVIETNVMASADVLFEQHSIKEIQEIEKKLRNDIEKKKEELRQMVGERYRDLMEAADTITEMRDISENVKTCVNTVEKFCIHLKQNCLHLDLRSSLKNKVLERQKKNENHYTIASLIKILMEAPTKIWNLIEGGDYLNALLLYLLARKTHSLLVLDPVYSKQDVLLYFPVINKQWTSIRHFQHILLQKSKHILDAASIELKSVLGPLCCVAFLSDTSTEQILKVFLSARKVAVSKIFKPEKSAKAQLCELVDVIQNSLKILHDLFYIDDQVADNKTSFLQVTISSIMKKDHPGPVFLLDKSSPTFPYLPNDVLAFRPVLNTKNETIGKENFQSFCEEWIESVHCEIRNKVLDLLEYVTSVKSLAVIREAVLQQSAQIENWSTITLHLFNSHFSVWDYFLRFSFMERIKVLISSQVEKSCRLCSEEIVNMCEVLRNGSLPSQEVSNVSNYIWTESESDIAPNLCWVQHHQRQLLESGTLKLKAYALSPKIQSICSSINCSLESTLTDISHFSVQEKLQTEWFSRDYEAKSNDNIDRKLIESEIEDFKVIRGHLTFVTEMNFFSLTNHIEQMLTNFEKSTQSDKTVHTASECVFLGYLCFGLALLCPNLSKCLLKGNPNLLSTSFKHGANNASKQDDELWQNLKTRLLDLNNTIFKLWGRTKMEYLAQSFSSELSVCSGSGLLKCLLQWDKIEIQEESEEGNPVTSILQIPQQISVPLYNSLFRFCWELNEIGCHALSSQVKTEFRENLLLLLLRAYLKKVQKEWPIEVFSPHLAQTQALQLLFDVQYLMGLLAPREHIPIAISDLSKDILQKVSSHIDPFDMDVFYPYIQTNLRSALQRSVLIFGLIASSDQTSYLNSLKSISSQMEHNLMLLPPLISRLPLLPFATHSSCDVINKPVSSYPSVQQQSSPVKTTRAHNSSPNLSASDNLTNVLKSSSFYNRVTAMSNSWFGGI